MKRCDFIDWMKAIGMFVIVFGHFFGEPYNQLTQPVYPKQLGVAIFVFIMGWGLGKETRPKIQVAFNRIFPMFFWGIVIALFISVLNLILNGDLMLSNYAPFVFGVNVLFDGFPANPTTWFIGTYLHIILLWALILYRLKVTPLILIISLIFEIFVRASLIANDTIFIAYMSVPNWLTLFLLGMYMRDKQDSTDSSGLLPILAGWLAFTALWVLLLNTLDVTGRFPFREVQLSSGLTHSLITSCAISVVYLIHTVFFVAVFSKIKAGNLVRFFSRNTIIVFIGHMPLFFVLEPIVRQVFPSGWPKRLSIVIIMFVGLSLLSEFLHKVIKVNELKNKLWKLLNLQAIYKTS